MAQGLHALEEEKRMTMDMTIPKLIEEIAARHAPSDLDDHVHELKSKEASAINNAGIEAQVTYLVEQGGEEWVREVFLPKED